MILHSLMSVYYTSSVVFFYILGHFIAKNFQLIAQRIDEVHNEKVFFVNVDQLLTQIRNWKRQHFALFKCVDQINKCFGILLLPMISFVFVAVINLSFFSLSAMSTPLYFFGSVLMTSLYLVYLWGISNIAENVRVQVQITLKLLDNLVNAIL